MNIYWKIKIVAIALFFPIVIFVAFVPTIAYAVACQGISSQSVGYGSCASAYSTCLARNSGQVTACEEAATQIGASNNAWSNCIDNTPTGGNTSACTSLLAPASVYQFSNISTPTTPPASTFNCSAGQTWSSQGNNGAGGCIAIPQTSNTTSDCSSISNNGIRGSCNEALRGCVSDPACVNRTVEAYRVREITLQQCTAAGRSNCATEAAQAGVNSIQQQISPTSPSQTPQTCTGPNCGNLGYVPLEPIGFDLSGIQNTNQNAFGEWLSFLLKIAISIGGLAAVVMLVFGGVVYMVSEVVDKKHEALERIQASFLGLFILIASWLILNTINPQLVTGTNFFRITPTSTSGNIVPNNPSVPQTQQSLQAAINECLARSSSRTCVYEQGANGPQCRC